MTSRPTEDLDSLTSRASKAVERTSRRDIRPAPPRNRPLPILLLAGVALMAGAVIYQNVSPPSPTRVARDLDAVVEQARASVEESRKASGMLPEALPNASLSAVVHYEPKGDAYRLSATVPGVRVTLEPDGAKQIEYGAAP